MPKKNLDLIQAIKETSQRLKSGESKYEWGHMGRCNCGHLVQTITKMSDHEIVKAVNHQLDEWSEHAKDYCEGTGHSVDDLFMTMEKVGFDHQDMHHLERLSDPEVLSRLPEDKKHLRRNAIEDVCLYFDTMATVLEEKG